MLPVYHWKRVKVGDRVSTSGTRSSLTRLYKRILHRTRLLKTSSTETHPILDLRSLAFTRDLRAASDSPTLIERTTETDICEEDDLHGSSGMRAD